MDMKTLAERVAARVPAYGRFLAEQGASTADSWLNLPLTNKVNYLLKHPLPDLCWDGSLHDCHLIGSSSGFSKTGSVYWPKRPEDESNYLALVEQTMIQCHGIDQRKTLIFICLAFGTWIGGMQLASVMRTLAASGRHPLTVATPGLNLSEAVEIYQQFGSRYDQVLWITNPSNASIIISLLAELKNPPPPASLYFPVVGEYFTETFREDVAKRTQHPTTEPFVLWTGYGSADTGDLGMETRETIQLRKFFHHHPKMSQQFFGHGNTPMLLAPSAKSYLEVVDGNLVVTKDQLVPLVRYDTKDSGGLLQTADLTDCSLPEGLLESLPETLLFIRGRVSDAVVFYGTNLMMGDLADFFLQLPKHFCYGGFFKVKPDQSRGFAVFHFTVYITGQATQSLEEQYTESLITFLQNESLEFKTKYEVLCRSVQRPLISVELNEKKPAQGMIKHKYIIEE